MTICYLRALLCFTCHDSKQYVLYRLFSALPLFFYLGWFIIRIFCIPVWIQPSKTENQVNDLREGIAGILLFSSSIVFKENRNSVENIQMPKNRQKKRRKEHLVILMSCYVKRALKKCQKKYLLKSFKTCW